MNFEYANAAIARGQPVAQVFTRELRCTGRVCDHGPTTLSLDACGIGSFIWLTLNDHRVLALSPGSRPTEKTLPPFGPSVQVYGMLRARLEAENAEKPELFEPVRALPESGGLCGPIRPGRKSGAAPARTPRGALVVGEIGFGVWAKSRAAIRPQCTQCNVAARSA